MITSPHMGLNIWDDAKDDFDHAQLADNFVAIDNHDHTPGKGKPISAEALESGSITSAQIAEEAIEAKNIQNGSVGSEQIDPEFLPLGTVIMWYRLNPEVPLPGGGWEVMDGREWKNVENDMGYNTGNLPNFTTGRFPRGAVASGEGIEPGDTGGASTASLAHSHSVESHTHSVPSHTHSIPSHTHGISSDGGHSHVYHGTFPSEGSYNLFQHRVGIPQGTGEGQFTQALRLANTHNLGDPEFEVPMLEAGTHSHTGSTGATGGTTGGTGATSGAATPNTDSKLGATSIIPPYTGLLFLIKCR